MERRRGRSMEFRGDLQAEVMAAVWELGEATVDDVRAQQPRRRRSAYNTVQTVLNRLTERGLLQRERRGRAFYYSPKARESEYLANTINERLAQASPGARREALLNLVGQLEGDDLDELARYANRIKRARGK